MPKKFDIKGSARLFKITRSPLYTLVPPVVLLLSKHPAVEKYDLRLYPNDEFWAAPLTKRACEALYKRLNSVKQGMGFRKPVQQRILSLGRLETKPWCCRHPSSNQTAKYMSPDEKEVPVGQTGELWIKGPTFSKVI